MLNCIFVENLTTTIAEVETQSRKSEYERLKLSSAVSSLEAFRMNMTQSNCSELNLIFDSIIPFDIHCIINCEQLMTPITNCACVLKMKHV